VGLPSWTRARFWGDHVYLGREPLIGSAGLGGADGGAVSQVVGQREPKNFLLCTHGPNVAGDHPWRGCGVCALFKDTQEKAK
jgi:hypothetical protein